MSHPRDDHSREPEGRLDASEVRRLAVSGAFVVGLRGLGIKALALVGNVFLTRLLVPRDFGVVAFGTTLIVFGTLLADGGLGAALIRRSEQPGRRELQALVALQLLVTGALAVVTAVAAQPFGEAGRVTSVMVLALPLTAFRTPGAILLQRELAFGPIVVVELFEALAYYGWAIATVASGWGVWGLATAAVIRSIAGTAVMARCSPIGLLTPALSWAGIRGIVSFGARYQAVGLVNVVRDEGLNVGTAAIGGLNVLGLWALASRVLQLPFLLFESLWRVSYPAMSRLVATGEDVRATIERTLRLVATATGGVLALLVGAGPSLVPVVFGPQWRDASDILPWASLGLMIGGPVSVAAAGYLYAIGDASTVLRGVLLHTLAWFAVAFPLLPHFGEVVLGVGWLAAGIVEALVLGRAISRRAKARVASLLLVPTSAAVFAAATGWIITSSMRPVLTTPVLGALVAEVAFLAFLMVVDRRMLLDVLAVARRAARMRLPTPATRGIA